MNIQLQLCVGKTRLTTNGKVYFGRALFFVLLFCEVDPDSYGCGAHRCLPRGGGLGSRPKNM